MRGSLARRDPFGAALLLLVAGIGFGAALAPRTWSVVDPYHPIEAPARLSYVAAMLLIATLPFAFRTMLLPAAVVLALLGSFHLPGIPPLVGVFFALAWAGLGLQLVILFLGRRFLPGAAPLTVRTWLALAAWLLVVLASAGLAVASSSPSQPQRAWLVVGPAAAWALLWLLPWLRRQRIEAHVEICRPPEEVFAVLRDLERLPSWQSQTRSVERLPAVPGAIDRVRRLERQPDGSDAILEVRLLEAEPPRRIVISTSYGRRTYYGEATLAASGCGTRLRVSMRPVLPWAGAVLGGRFAGVQKLSQTQNQQNLELLKQLVEAQPGGAA